MENRLRLSIQMHSSVKHIVILSCSEKKSFQTDSLTPDFRLWTQLLPNIFSPLVWPKKELDPRSLTFRQQIHGGKTEQELNPASHKQKPDFSGRNIFKHNFLIHLDARCIIIIVYTQ